MVRFLADRTFQPRLEIYDSWPADPTHLLPPDPAHGLQLTSLYSAVQGAEPPFTNYTEGFKGTLDYIWVTTTAATAALGAPTTCPAVEPVAVLSTPTEAQLAATCKNWLPNEQFASDHLPLCADVTMHVPAAATAGGNRRRG